MNKPRVYKNSTLQTVLIVLIFLITALMCIPITLMAGRNGLTTMLPFAIALVIFLLFSLYNTTSKTIISDDEISSGTVFGTTTLKWNEVSLISGKGHAIKLQNNDGDMIVAPNPQLPKYEEVVEIIGIKHPNLFTPQEYKEMPVGISNILVQSLIGLLLIGVIVITFISTNQAYLLRGVIIYAFAVSVVLIFTPKSISIQDDSILITYLFNKKTISVDEIASITIGHAQSFSKRYHVQISKKQGGNIRVSNLKPNMPVAYLVLKNWHKKNTSIRQLPQQN